MVAVTKKESKLHNVNLTHRSKSRYSLALDNAGQPAFQATTQHPPSPAVTAATEEENVTEADDEVNTIGRPHNLLRGTTGHYEKLDPCAYFRD